MVNEETKEFTLLVISSRADLQKIEKPDKSVENIHIAFRPSGKDVVMATEKFPNIEMIHMPVSYGSTMAGFVMAFLDNKKIMFIEGDVQGHRQDIDAYARVKIPVS